MLNCMPQTPRASPFTRQRRRSQSDGDMYSQQSRQRPRSNSAGGLKGLFRRSRSRGTTGSGKSRKYSPPSPMKTATRAQSTDFSFSCLPSLSHLIASVAPPENTQHEPTEEQTSEPCKPREDSKGEKVAKDLYSKGKICKKELVSIMKGEEEYWSDTREQLRDPITLEPLGEYVFTFVRQNGTVAHYNLESLVEYFLASGDFREPEARIEVSDEDLKSMDSMCKLSGIQVGSVCEAKKKPEVYREKHQRQEMITGLDRLVGGVISTMVTTAIESGTADDGQIRLLLELFPQFQDWFGQLSRADSVYAQQCLTQYTALVEGPPNRPIKDKTGLKPVVLRFLHKHRRYGVS